MNSREQPADGAPEAAVTDGGPRQLVATAEDAGQRIDNYLLRILRGVPRMRVYRLLRRGEVRVNGGRVKPGHRLQTGDHVRVPPVRQRRYAGGRLPGHQLARLRDSIRHEDAVSLAIDKPAGLAVHAGSGLGGGVIDGLRQLRPDICGLELVHRLDRDTSGCLLLAKGRPALRRLQAELRGGGFVKVYTALLLGDWPGPEATVDAPLRRTRLDSGERRVRVDPEGRSARSHFRRLDGDGRFTLVEVEIETGRTHQIRVHAAHLGHPVVGDTRYGDAAGERAALGGRARRMYLHATRLTFTGEHGPVTLECPPPAGFAAPLQPEPR
ncbi:MAG: RluA family pseudouridine synthase [Halofilum sp. (in: g-proteobacteria)]|nr:RluA family pseudouridine synthase [Halofilum sp. (in: g-proteobacteria)]